MKKKYIAAAAAVILVLSACSRNEKPGQDSGFPAGIPDEVTVERLEIQDSVSVSGNIGPYRSRQLGFSTTGKITSINVKEGDLVKKGTILARIDTSREEFDIEAKEYELEQARFSESPRKLALMEKELESMKKVLENRVITAPFDGVIAKINKQEGEISYTNTSTDYLILLIDSSKLKAEVVVDELDISKIAPGQRTEFAFDALEHEFFNGRVSSIAAIGRLNERGLPVTDVELVIDEPDPRILIPYSFRADIITSEPRECLVIDDKAVRWENDRIYAEVIVGEASETEKREIKIEPWKDGKSIVLEGLKDGDKVKTPSEQLLPEEISG